MAPLPSEADNNVAPTVTIDGAAVALTRIANNASGVCPNDTAFNSCWSLNGTNVTTEATRNNTIQYGRYRVGDYSASNGARILINDSSAVGSVDNIKMTGITFWTPAGGTTEGDVIITHTFNEGGGNPRGDYKWGLAMGGQFDPPSNENVAGDRLRLTASGVFNSTVPLGSLDTCPLCSPPAATPTSPAKIGFDTPTTNNLLGYVSKSAAATVKQADCRMPANANPGKCFPTVTLNYRIKTVGFDQLQMSDSVSGCGSSCFTPQPECPPVLLLSADAEEDGEEGSSCPEQGDLPLCTDQDLLCEPIIESAVSAIDGEGMNSGGVEACSGDCIVNVVQAKPVKKGAGQTFSFKAEGPGLSTPGESATLFAITTNVNGIGAKVFKDLVPSPSEMGLRIFRLPASTFPKKWELEKITCVSSLNNGTSSFQTRVGDNENRGRVRVLKLGAGDTITCTWLIEYDD